MEAGANVDKKDGFGRDALDHAAKGGNVSTFCQVGGKCPPCGAGGFHDTKLMYRPGYVHSHAAALLGKQ